MTANSARERMDGLYRRQRHIYDATRKLLLPGRDRLIAHLRPSADGTVLEVACGTARNLVKAAGRYPDARLYGFDISGEMLKTARATVARHRLLGRITLAEADATAFDATLLFGRSRFDRVFISYALSMIPSWPEALARALDVVAPGGELHIVDFGRQERLPGWFRSALRGALGAFTAAPRDELESCLRALAGARGAGISMHSLYGGYAIHAIVSRAP
jgi:S-adenosylmethionine-diacylgycerolhomoserine-N-methlytransferase